MLLSSRMTAENTLKALGGIAGASTYGHQWRVSWCQSSTVG
jgi:hypothetical protein